MTSLVSQEEQLSLLEAGIARARRENQQLETMIEEQTRHLYLTQQALEKSQAFLESVLRSMQSALIITDPDDLIISVGGTTESLAGRDEAELIGRPFSDLVMTEGDGEAEIVSADGPPVPVLVTRSVLSDDHDEQIGTVHVAVDLRERRQLEVELRHAQRLESIGQLAAGVAHEINTPLQYVSDSAWFLGDILEELIWVIGRYEDLGAAVAGEPEVAEIVDEIAAKADDMDLEFLKEEAPRAAQRTLDGLERVTKIVRAMKQFAHPGSDDMAPANLLEMIESTVTVARNEFKYVADIDVHVDPSHEIVCDKGDIGQVFINLVVNAAHAINDQVEGTGDRGEIVVTSRPEAGGMMIEFADTGGGVPEAIRDRIFDPFFTTKEPGKGTGQGLALAYNVVAKHGGRITLEVEDGVGSTFRIWLPGGGQ